LAVLFVAEATAFEEREGFWCRLTGDEVEEAASRRHKV
jgi:hypothetical protein